MKTKLTDRQKEILDFIRKKIQRNNLPPTVREICEEFGIASPRGVTDHLNALERKGYIRRDAGKSRAIHLTARTNRIEFDGIPIVGRVAAGHPVLAEEHVEGTLKLEDVFGSRTDLMAVTVQGDSMVDCGIYDGDFVIVRRNANFANGAIAVAFVDGEATVKKIYKMKKGYKLKPENKRYKDILVDETNEFEVAGPVVGVVRGM